MADSSGFFVDEQGLGGPVGPLAHGGREATRSLGPRRKGRGLERGHGHMWREHVCPGACSLTTYDKWGWRAGP